MPRPPQSPTRPGIVEPGASSPVPDPYRHPGPYWVDEAAPFDWEEYYYWRMGLYPLLPSQTALWTGIASDVLPACGTYAGIDRSAYPYFARTPSQLRLPFED